MHRPPEPASSVAEREGFATPAEISQYMKLERPFIMRNALNGTGLQRIQSWTPDYVLATVPDAIVNCELQKKETAQSKHGAMTVRKFFADYAVKDVYLVASVPKILLAEVGLPRGFQRIFDAATQPSWWFSNGGTKSALHRDPDHNINCIVKGHKRWYLWDYKEMGEYFQEEEENNREKTFADLDVDSVDMKRFGALHNVAWYNFTIHEGDCLFIPEMWYHHVAGFADPEAGYNMAFNFWFNLQGRARLANIKGSDEELVMLDDSSWGYARLEDGKGAGTAGHLEEPNAYGREQSGGGDKRRRRGRRGGREGREERGNGGERSRGRERSRERSRERGRRSRERSGGREERSRRGKREASSRKPQQRKRRRKEEL